MLRNSTPVAWSVGLLAIACSVACSGPKPSVELEAELRRMQESEHVFIGFRDYPTQVLNWLPMDGRMDGGTRQVKLTPAELDSIRPGSDSAFIVDKGRQSLASPNGRWAVRQQEENVIIEERGQGIVKTIVQSNKVIGKMHWSPDSTFVMYVERASKWDPTALRMLDNVVYVTVYRCRDGQRAHLKRFGEGAAAAPWEWLHVPPGLLQASGR
jgi:hypothetical protein